MQRFDAMLHEQKLEYPCVLKPNVAQSRADLR